jgi:hypothetical protein
MEFLINGALQFDVALGFHFPASQRKTVFCKPTQAGG